MPKSAPAIRRATRAPPTRTVRRRSRVRAPSVYRDYGITYLDVPSRDPRESASFFRSLFGWRVEERPGAWSFQDGTGHVIGHFVPDRASSGKDGVLPYIYVPSVDRTLRKVPGLKGKIVRKPFPVGELWVATIRDPSSNVIGVWQRGPR